MNSTRLPGKMLLPLAGAPLLQRVIERVQRATKLDDLVLAVPSKDAADFAPICNGRAWLYAYPGDESDLVGRYLRAALAHDADLIVRVPCDNPCIEGKYIDEAVEQYLDECHTFYSNTTVGISQPDKFRILYVDGLGCEVLSVSRLKWLDRKTHGHPRLREHPHGWFYEQRNKWESEGDCGITINSLEPESTMSQLRLDVNMPADYDFIADIYAALWPSNNNFTITDILAYLETKKATA